MYTSIFLGFVVQDISYLYYFPKLFIKKSFKNLQSRTTVTKMWMRQVEFKYKNYEFYRKQPQMFFYVIKIHSNGIIVDCGVDGLFSRYRFLAWSRRKQSPSSPRRRWSNATDCRTRLNAPNYPAERMGAPSSPCGEGCTADGLGNLAQRVESYPKDKTE